jgi:hypothetical protein
MVDSFTPLTFLQLFTDKSSLHGPDPGLAYMTISLLQLLCKGWMRMRAVNASDVLTSKLSSLRFVDGHVLVL